MATKPMYQKIDSNESTESILEAQPIPHSKSPLHHLLSKPRLHLLESKIVSNPITTIISILLCLSFILNIFALGNIASVGSIGSDGSDGIREGEGEVYGKDTRYMSLDHKYDHLWIRISSDHVGLMKVIDPGSEHPGREEGALGVMSMFHQLHCLSSFRNALQDAYDGREVALDFTGNRHWPHCLDYMRKAILCNADDTLEREKIVNGTRTFKIDGITDLRVCRDNGHIYEALRKHGLPDAKGPLADLEEESSRLDINE